MEKIQKSDVVEYVMKLPPLDLEEFADIYQNELVEVYDTDDLLLHYEIYLRKHRDSHDYRDCGTMEKWLEMQKERIDYGNRD